MRSATLFGEKLAALDEIVERPQTAQQTTQLVEPQRIGAIGQRLLRLVVCLDEQTIDADRDCRPGQCLDVPRLAARSAARSAGQLYAVSGIEDHRPAKPAHDRK